MSTTVDKLNHEGGELEVLLVKFVRLSGLRLPAHLQSIIICSGIAPENAQLSIGPTEGLRLYRSLRAVKVLLASLRSTLTVLASRMGGSYRFALEEQSLIS